MKTLGNRKKTNKQKKKKKKKKKKTEDQWSCKQSYRPNTYKNSQYTTDQQKHVTKIAFD